MSEIERESMEVDILYVGAGPANLASAYHLMKQVDAYNETAAAEGREPMEPPVVLVIEKAAGIGDHQLSGAVINPIAIRELIPDFVEQGFPTEYVCDDAQFIFFGRKFTLKSPICPPMFQKNGYHVASLSNVVKWLGGQCEELGIEIYPGFAAVQILTEGDKIIGVRTGDMGIDKDGNHKPTFQPGMDILAKVTVLGEGVRGSLTKQLVEQFEMDGPNPQSYKTGIKEIWRVKPEKHKPGRVIHGSLFPDAFKAFDGMWLYDMKDNLVSFGYVTEIASENPNNDAHLKAQKFKTTPFMRNLLEGAELVRYGAKCVPAGGLYSQPKLYANGALLVGDGASMLNIMSLAGIHMAIKTGMLAAETIVDALSKNDFSTVTLGGYTERYKNSWAYEEHLRARNWEGSVEIGPLFLMGINMPLILLTKGRGLIEKLKVHPPHEAMRKLWQLPAKERKKEDFQFDGKLTFSKEHLVGFSGTAHEADQPPHLKVADTDICATLCSEEYGNPCESFCPAAVYEMVDDTNNPGHKTLFIHHENCVHCKTCDIADPYQIITWTPPQGGEGPDYTQM
ncbi:MAG: electron transfer flavoprotein-ubiquinone oxidoreductase [Deltaproteobacteria bacterium]|nr:electron transfer flavoprotein-ubiquinone oxidoreductase [Deltaproteobacteria bacterium]MBW2382979.1 electron transfer flavoprotein-ubiquinone oxidoreductase [Deltaproteobacteria bacterium]